MGLCHGLERLDVSLVARSMTPLFVDSHVNLDMGCVVYS